MLDEFAESIERGNIGERVVGYLSRMMPTVKWETTVRGLNFLVVRWEWGILRGDRSIFLDPTSAPDRAASSILLEAAILMMFVADGIMKTMLRYDEIVEDIKYTRKAAARVYA